MHSALCHCPLQSEWGCFIRQSKFPACLTEVKMAHQNISHSLVKMTDKICINGKFSAQKPSEWRYFSIPVSNFTVFQPRIQTDSSSVGRSSQVVLKLIRPRIWQLSHRCQTSVWEYFPSSLALNIDIWRWNVDFRPKWYILWSQCG